MEHLEYVTKSSFLNETCFFHVTLNIKSNTFNNIEQVIFIRNETNQN